VSLPSSEKIEIQRVAGPIRGLIRPPGSKSITNRALLLSALAAGESVLSGVLDSEDTRVMMEALGQLGVLIQPAEFGISDQGALPDGQAGSVLGQQPGLPVALKVQGCGGQFPQQAGRLFLENSGTSIRFLTAALGVAGGDYILDGIERMRQRPIRPLVEALQMLGVGILARSANGCPPVEIKSARIAGGKVVLDGSLSSQYLSGLLMAAPLAPAGMEIEIQGELVSRPYVKMTLEMMKAFGVSVSRSLNERKLIIPGQQHYRGIRYAIEPDASAASYFWGAAAICGGTATVQGLTPASLQGDVGFVKALEQMGCQVLHAADSITVAGPAIRGIEIDMSQISDTVQTLAVVALFVEGQTQIRNVAHNRLKETDRIRDLATELRQLGAEVQEHEDGLTINPPDPARIPPAVTLQTYNDHRMAMSLSLAGLRIPGVSIADPGCVVKTYPDFFSDLHRFLGRGPAAV
jgi:3-phosphoshikimate 1-carboxyvinyltransferase